MQIRPIPSIYTRLNALQNVAGRWLAFDRSAAMQWIANSSLNEQERAIVLGQGGAPQQAAAP